MDNDRCPTSHIEADGQLRAVFPASQNPNRYVLISIEIFPGRHVCLYEGVLACPTCHTYVGRPFFPLDLPKARGKGRKDELALCRRYQPRR